MNEEQVEDELRRIARIISAEPDQLPTVCRLQGGGRTNIEISNDGTLSYEAYERGLQIYCYTFTDLDGLMYHTFKDIVPRLATAYATEMEAIGQDFREHLYSKMIELMSKIKPEWGKRMKAGFEEEPY